MTAEGRFILYLVTNRSGVRFFENFDVARDHYLNFKGTEFEVCMVSPPKTTQAVVDLLNRSGFAKSMMRLEPRHYDNDIERLDIFEVILDGGHAAAVRDAGWIAFLEDRSYGTVTRVWVAASTMAVGIEIGDRIIEVAGLEKSFVRGIYNWSLESAYDDKGPGLS